MVSLLLLRIILLRLRQLTTFEFYRFIGAFGYPSLVVFFSFSVFTFRVVCFGARQSPTLLLERPSHGFHSP